MAFGYSQSLNYSDDIRGIFKPIHLSSNVNNMESAHDFISTFSTLVNVASRNVISIGGELLFTFFAENSKRPMTVVVFTEFLENFNVLKEMTDKVVDPDALHINNQAPIEWGQWKLMASDRMSLLPRCQPPNPDECEPPELG